MKSWFSQGGGKRLPRHVPGVGVGGQVLVPKKNSRDRARLWEAATVWTFSACPQRPPPRFSELIKGNVTSPGGSASLQQLTVTVTDASLY